MWAAVPGYEAEYEVSADGEFRRISTRSGKCLNEPKPRSFGFRRGYRSITLCQDGIKRTYQAHRIVWEAFKGSIPEGLQINHKNGSKTDNRLANLEVMTPSENTRHAFTHLGRKPVINGSPGSKNPRAILSEEDIPLIFQLREAGLSQQKIADQYGVAQTTISRVLLKETWKIK